MKSMIAQKGDWVRIKKTVLQPENRAPQIPADTKEVPLTMWVKGYLVDEVASCGDLVSVRTYIGREIEGTLIEVNPSYTHDYGKCVPELLYIGNQIRNLLAGGAHHV